MSTAPVLSSTPSSRARLTRAIVVASTPVWSRSSQAARADRLQPRTAVPLACQAATAAPSANVLPVPAAERTTWTPSPERVKRHDEIALVAAQAPAGVESGSDGFRLGDGDGRRPAAFGTVQQLALGHEQRTRRALGLEASALQRNDLVPVEEGGCEPFDHGDARAARRRLRE